MAVILSKYFLTVKQPVGITSIQHTAASPLQDDKITLIKASVDKNEALPGIMTPGKDDELMKLMNIQGGATDFPKEYADALTRGANQRIGKLPPVPIAGQDLLRPIIDRDQATSDQAYEMATGLGISRTEPGLSWAKEMIQQKY